MRLRPLLSIGLVASVLGACSSARDSTSEAAAPCAGSTCGGAAASNTSSTTSITTGAMSSGTNGTSTGTGGMECAAVPPIADAPIADKHLLYPDPVFAEASALGARVHAVCVDTTALASHATLDTLVAGAVGEAGLIAGTPPCACDLTLRFQSNIESIPLSADAAAAWAAAGAKDERYVASSSVVGGRGLADLYAVSERGGLYALRAALAMVRPDPADSKSYRMTKGTIVDYPAFDWRGVVEGFYGNPYKVDDRATLLRLMSRLRENVYVYGPKDDPYASLGDWATPYSLKDGSAQVIQAASHDADANLVKFVWAISPGHADKYDFSNDDYTALTQKLDNLRTYGVKHFAIFMDDGSDGTAAQQAVVMNKLDDYLKQTDPKDHLMMVGERYAFGPTAYTDALGAALHPDIEVMWTGNDIEPATMKAGDMKAIHASLKRSVTIWDNWPNTPGGFTGRSADLPAAVLGYYTNPVLNEMGAHPSKTFWQVLGPIADYLWDSARYDASNGSPGASYQRFQPLLDPMLGLVAPCPPCGSNAPGWTCDFTTNLDIYYCDGVTKCLTSFVCPGGCMKEPNPNPDNCL